MKSIKVNKILKKHIKDGRINNFNDVYNVKNENERA